MKPFRRSFNPKARAVGLSTIASIAGMLGCSAAVAEDEAAEGEPVAQSEQPVIPGAAVKQVVKYHTLPAGGVLEGASATCPSGSVVVGGGYYAAHDTRVYTTGINLNSWSINILNLSNSMDKTVRVYAECLSGTNATTGTSSPGAVVLGKNGGTGCVYAQCPSGKLLTGGGYYAPTPFRPSANQLFTGARWQVCGWNEHPTESITVFAYPVCIGGVSGEVTRLASLPVLLRAGSNTVVTGGACASGLLLGSGGYSTAVTRVYAQAMGRSELDANKWSNTLLNLSSTTQSGNVVSSCLNLWP